MLNCHVNLVNHSLVCKILLQTFYYKKKQLLIIYIYFYLEFQLHRDQIDIDAIALTFKLKYFDSSTVK